MRWSEVTAIFGGTFDPPHLGHREAVRGLFQNPGVRRVIIVPSATPPFKTARATPEQRAEMARLNFADLGDVVIDPRELRRSGPSYTFDTLKELQREGLQSLAFVIGTDQIETLPKWHAFPEVLALAHWIVLERKGQKPVDLSAIQAPLRAARREVIVCPTPAPQLSSTSIREAIALRGEPPEGALFPAVDAYLKMHHMYGTSGAKVVN